MRFGSRYLQILGVMVISIAFSILGYYPSNIIPIWGQVAFMFLGSAVLLLAGEILMERKEMEFYAMGLIFAGVKLVYSSFWSLYQNFDLIDGSTFTLALILTLGFHYGTSLRYHSAVLNASFVLLSWVPLVLLHDLYGQDDLIIILFLLVLSLDYLQAHTRKEVTAILMVPAAAAIYLYLNAYKRTVYDFSFELTPHQGVLIPVLMLFTVISLHFLSEHYRSRTLLSDFLKERPGTTFSHLMSLFLMVTILVSYPFLAITQFLFLLLFVLSSLIVTHFRRRIEEMVVLTTPLSTALLVSLATLIALHTHESLLLLLLSFAFILLLSFAFILFLPFAFIPLSVSASGFPLQESRINLFHRRIIGAFISLLCFSVLFFWLFSPYSLEFLPTVALLLAIGTQLLVSYSVIRDLHIIIGEIALLLGAAAYGWSSGNTDGYTGIWIIIVLMICIISYGRKNGDLLSRMLLILALETLATIALFGTFVIIPAALMILMLFLLSLWYRGPYFLHRIMVPVNEISHILRKHRVLDLYNVALIFSLAISVVSLTLEPEAWVTFPLVSLLFLFSSLRQHRGKMVLPLLVLCAGTLVIYLEGLLLLVYLTMFPLVILLLLLEPMEAKIDHYLLMMLFLTVGLAVGINDLRGPWLWDVLGLDRVLRLSVVYAFYLIALFTFLSLSRRYSSLLFTGIVALGELAALLMFTFEYGYGIQLFFAIDFLLMGYFGLYAVRWSPMTHSRGRERDRNLLMAMSSVLYILPLILFNYRNDLPEPESWAIGMMGLFILLSSDIHRYGLHLRGWKGSSSTLLPGITLVEFFALFLPTLLCMNYSDDGSLWMFLLLFIGVLLFLVFRESRSRVQLLTLYGLMFFLPFNLLLYVGKDPARSLHWVSDLIPVSLVLLYITVHVIPTSRNSTSSFISRSTPSSSPPFAPSSVFPSSSSLSSSSPPFAPSSVPSSSSSISSSPISTNAASISSPMITKSTPLTTTSPASKSSSLPRKRHSILHWLFPEEPEYMWITSLAILLLGTLGCSHFGLVIIPLAMFFFCLRMKDVLVTPASYVMFMVIFYLYFGSSRNEIDTAMNGLLILSLLPIFLALFNEFLYRVRALTFSFSTLSLFLMGGVPWFAAHGGTFTGTIITHVIWTIFGGTSLSAGFYLDRKYLRYYGLFFLCWGVVVIVYNTVVLGVELVVGSLLVFGVIAMIASYFYYLSLIRQRKKYTPK